uniref:EGF-like domain-containing protein n=1 Tax=Globodera pallida TaxID=36090 RepID=A0A183CFP1_GLOPA
MPYFCNSVQQCWGGSLDSGNKTDKRDKIKVINCDAKGTYCFKSQCYAVSEVRTHELWHCTNNDDRTNCAVVSVRELKKDPGGDWSCTCVFGKQGENLPSDQEPTASAPTTPKKPSPTPKKPSPTPKKPSTTTKKALVNSNTSNGHRPVVDMPLLVALVVPMLIGQKFLCI